MMKSLWNKYSLSIVLGTLWILCWIIQTYTGWVEFGDEQQSHGEVATLADYAFVWARTTFENAQSEYLQLFSFVVLSTFLMHKNSPQSKDGDERMETKIDRILAHQENEHLQFRTYLTQQGIERKPVQRVDG